MHPAERDCKIDAFLADDEVGNAFLAQVGEVLRGRGAGNEHQEVELAATLRKPLHSPATVDHREPFLAV